MGSWGSVARWNLTKTEINKGRKCPIDGLRRKGMKPIKQLNLGEFQREITILKDKRKGRKQKEFKTKKVVNKEIITAKL